MIECVAIIGAGGCARDILDIFEACNADSRRYDILGFLVDERYGRAAEVELGG